jgi:Rod binding domain-containing protein
MEPLAGLVRRDVTVPGTPPEQPGPIKSAEMTQLRRAAREFEAVMIEHMLKTVRQSFPKSGFMPSGAGQSLYQDLADEQMAKAISRGGGLGLGDVIIRAMTRSRMQKASSPPPTQPIGEGDAGRTEGGPK